MKNKYIYKDEDITTDILFKIEHIANIIAEKENKSFDEIYANFLSSKTYIALQNTNTLMWAESAEFIVYENYREMSQYII
ncbi:MAG: hypothetical protein LBT79_02115 [Elusimicrobiota bacterium]|jgi:hypothetical protein|nr:hypothetical protein [Elusimicrobiota bacterium]